ncbi:MAG: HAD family hydrolase [Myxococcales bacterium]
MAIRCVVFDFDGTLTRVDDECVPFVQTYKDLLAKLIVAPGEELEPLWREAEARVDARVSEFGWKDEQNRIVAPAYADPLIKSRVIATELFARAGLFPQVRDRLAVLNLLFQVSYASMDPDGIFRPEAPGVLRQLVGAGLPVFVVTNSDQKKVLHKLKTVVPDLLDRVTVVGNARKFVVEGPADPWTGTATVPETITLEGVPRPVYLRRPHYLETLTRICRETDCSPQEVVACGDIYELDLLLPMQLGMKFHLVTRPPTPQIDRDVIGRLGGTVSDSLHGLAELVASSRAA